MVDMRQEDKSQDGTITRRLRLVNHWFARP